MRVLVVEDEYEIAQSIKEYLTKEGYTCELTSNYLNGDEKTQLSDYDCILLDITLPGGNGLDILKQLKYSKPDAAVIIISARNSLNDKVTGLELGADDYLTKPFHLSELNARIKSVIRRRNFAGSDIISFDKIAVDLKGSLVKINDKEINLTKKEYELLIYFLLNQNRIVTKEAIAERLLGEELSGGSFDFIYSHIKNLRKKLMESGAPEYIRAVYGMGYKFGKE